jgi:predicted ribosome quality control (RQC) complex YloA/Tae2 family protein
MTSFEYSYLLNELQSLVGKKINKIYELDNNLFRFKIGKEDLVVELGKRIHLTLFIDNAPEKPSNFTMFLRKRLKGAVIKKIYQHNTDRVIILECENEEKYKLIFEMFAKGNFIVLDNDNKIISPYHREDWKDRILRRNEKYIFPKNKTFSFKSSIEEIEELLDDKFIIVCLSKLPLGTIYIKQILDNCEIDEKKQGNTLTKENKIKIVKEIEKTVEKAAPYAHINGDNIEEVSLIKLKQYKLFPSLNEILDKYYYTPKEEEEEESKELKKLKNRLNLQIEHLKGLEEQETEFKKMGEKIYEKYSELEKLKTWINKKIAEKDWDTIDTELKKINAKINKKTKEVEIEIKN